jgi:hypothetical protein
MLAMHFFLFLQQSVVPQMSGLARMFALAGNGYNLPHAEENDVSTFFAETFGQCSSSSIKLPESKKLMYHALFKWCALNKIGYLIGGRMIALPRQSATVISSGSLFHGKNFFRVSDL